MTGSSCVAKPNLVSARVEEVCLRYPRRIAVVADGERVTFMQLCNSTRTVAERTARQDLPAGTAVTVAPSNNLAGIAAIFGLLAAGAVVVLVDPGLATPERIAVEQYTGVSLNYDLATGDLDPVRGSAGAKRDRPDYEAETALIFPTSGTTGKPKAVAHAHRSLLASSDGLGKVHRGFLLDLSPAQVALLARKVVTSPKSVGRMVAGKQVWATHAPIWSITGYTLLQTTLLRGYTFATQSQFHPRKALMMLEREGVNVYAAAPSVAGLLLRAAVTTRVKNRSLFCIGLGGELAQQNLVRKLRDTFGCLVTVGYGSTELGGGVMAANQKPNGGVNVGLPLPGTSARVMDVNGNSCQPGSVGHLEVRSEAMMTRYLHEDPSQTFASGWFRTGDLAVIAKSGRITIVGRADAMIVRHGVNVDADYLRDVLERHPAVAEASVIGETNAKTGATEVWAFLELKGHFEPSRSELALYCRSQTTSRLVPDHFRTVSQLPRTATGKVSILELRRRVWREDQRPGQLHALP